MNDHVELTWAVQPFEPDPQTLYSIDAAAHVTGSSRHDILMYCKRGLLTPVVDPEYGALSFNEEALRTLQRIEYLRGDCGINFTGVRIILDLMHEVQRLREVAAT